MADSWATETPSDSAADFAVGSDLHLELSRTGGVRASLMSALRDAVRSGRLAPGTHLPSSRTLATDLGIARNTVADAYAELVAEGWLTARRGAGTRVAPGAVPPRPVAPRAPTRPSLAASPTFDLHPGAPDASSFPRAAWLTSSRRALTNAPSSAFGVNDPRGRVELRRVLTEYLARARGVRADPERIVICSGFAHGLRLLAGVLVDAVRGGGPPRELPPHGGFGDAGRAAAWGRGADAAPDVLTGGARGRDGGLTVAVESYGLGFHRTILGRAGIRGVPLPVYEHGARVTGWRPPTPARCC